MPDSHTTAQVAAIYRFCAQSMQYPQSDWFTPGYIDALQNLLAALKGDEELLQLRKMAAAGDDLLEELQVEYTRLFITGVPHVAAPPYGSVYLQKTLRGKYSDEILAYYRACGYSLAPGAELPDHLVNQLEFLAALAAEGNRTAEEEFLRRFFLPWFQTFAAAVRAATAHPVYRIIIGIIDFFTKEEEDYGVQPDKA